MTGRYKAYSEYNSLDYPFLEKMPKHWEICPLKIVSKFRQGKLHEPYIHEDGKFICVNSRFVSTEGEKFKFCSKNLSPVENKDILMVMSDLPNGRALAKALYVQEDNNYALNQRVCAITATKIDARFLYYQLNRNEYFLSLDDGCNQTNLSNDIFKNFPTLVPSKEEQQKIANFLDHETTKIDTLITKQEKLIELLKEKRQAVISHAVTKGLNPGVPMKDSGVEWSGEIPKHWALKRIKDTASLINGFPFDSKRFEANNGIPLVRIRDINSNNTQVGFMGSVPDESLINYGDILIGMDGDFNVALWSGGIAALNQRVACIRADSELLQKYIYYILPFNMKAVNDLTYFTTVKHLSSIDILKTLYPLPPTNELFKIVNFLDEQTAKIDTLMAKQEKAIKLMKERKTALISAAVTGKIDVRNWEKR
jgi:restriction endonuclease S subunit